VELHAEEDCNEGLSHFRKLQNVVVKLGQSGVKQIYRSLTVSTVDTVQSIRLRLRRALDNAKDRECPLCFDEDCSLVCCSKCDGSYCSLCFVKLFDRNDGKIPCPFCRHVLGHLQLGVVKMVSVMKMLHRIQMPNVQKTRLHMSQNWEKAQRLYNMMEIEMETEMPDPENWIFNQTQMRASHEKIKAASVSANWLFRQSSGVQAMLSYSSFMYETYPPRWGDFLRVGMAEHDQIPFDAAKVFMFLLSEH
jgi:uncharacterized Zn finger protein (UPF0148 family)